MSIHIALHHQTHYAYDQPVSHGPHVIRLRPAPHCRTKILSYSLKISGGEHFINWQQDPFSNWNARLVFSEPMTELRIEVELIAEMAVYNPFDFFLEDSAAFYPFHYEPALQKDLAPFLEPSPLTPPLTSCLAAWKSELLEPPPIPVPGSLPSKIRTIDFLVALNRKVQREIQYLIRLEPGVQSPSVTLEKKSGSCRDSAWLLVHLLRHFGLAARFASGYLIQLKPDLKSLEGPSGASSDFTDLHAWCEVYLPGAGWIGFDPTSGLLAGEGHIPLSCTPEPSSAAPISGAVGPCQTNLHHQMHASRILESPRVTQPYTDKQWQQINTLGHSIDAALAQHGVRLTMGGEPTFVSIDDPDGPEWNFTAGSAKKRALSANLIRRLRRQFCPGALLHFGQGKWYPGEPLPRWALTAYWRKDGVPIWSDDSLIAEEKDYGHGSKEAHALTVRIARILGLDPKWILAAYEDVFYYTWRERRLPSNVTPQNSNLKDPLERERLARIFQTGPGEIAGYVLPIQPAPLGSPVSWSSGPWFLRDAETLWLLPGDSPIGLRLPLDSLPWVAERDFPWTWPQDPTAPFPQLPNPEAPMQSSIGASPPTSLRTHRGLGPFQSSAGSRPPGGSMARRNPTDPEKNTPSVRTQISAAQRPPAANEFAPGNLRTALCVEPREGRLHIFLPPISTGEDYLNLIAGIKIAVSELGLPVVIEGATPPPDPRLNKLAVTPDPGVIEVNLHPSASWDELVATTTTLYEEARLTRLATEKFMMDGRHTGTGGGNHIILGGETPADSPILRRPDLLQSLLAYWQNHPSLSWLFSGLFIGPTSQAPRIDEARHDSLYELNVAFHELDRQLKREAQSAATDLSLPSRSRCPELNHPLPWLVDRVFRNLLTDSTGNTHRAEFCIDKLYPPDNAQRRLGLLELRAFEMPPHPQMSLVQQLLLRGLIARFWREPYRQNLVRWGSDIHDRWMLPHYCENDFKDVLHDLDQSGFSFPFEWFAPHFEFRFPRIGSFAQRDVHVELRTALEPWHVLGEETGPAGTVRYVDSSLERLQVKVRGLAGNRFAIACNGRRIPLHPTGVNGEGVAGIRYRAWQPPECLQPTIPVHAPLVFDLFDSLNSRSLGGCTYHVVHPGGLSCTTFPVNAYEAESRRLARFFPHGCTQGSFNPPLPPLSETPFTLDLRLP